jgi:molecular chaperone GrpE
VSNSDHPTWPNPSGEDEPGVDENQTPGPEGENGDIAFEPEGDLARIAAERDEYLDQLQRSRAEFVNFRRRNDQERAQLRQFVTKDVTAQFLPVLDDFERAMTVVPTDGSAASFVQGVEMIRAKLQGIVERLGVTKVDALGQPFDPSVHEAVATEPGTDGSTVIEIYQHGYRIGDTLVRPAMVKTGNPMEDDNETPETFNA